MHKHIHMLQGVVVLWTQPLTHAVRMGMHMHMHMYMCMHMCRCACTLCSRKDEGRMVLKLSKD
jgi:hypothetical protein